MRQDLGKTGALNQKHVSEPDSVTYRGPSADYPTLRNLFLQVKGHNTQQAEGLGVPCEKQSKLQIPGSAFWLGADLVWVGARGWLEAFLADST